MDFRSSQYEVENKFLLRKEVVCGQFWRIICSELLALIQSSVKQLFLLKRVMAADGELQREFQGEITVNGGPCCLPSGPPKAVHKWYEMRARNITDDK